MRFAKKRYSSEGFTSGTISSHSRSPFLIQCLEVIVFQVYDVSQSLICLSLIGDITNYKKFHEC